MRVMPSSLSKFCLRLFFASALVGSFFVLTQDLQFFPGIILGYHDKSKGELRPVPPDVHLSILRTRDGELLESWWMPVTEQNGRESANPVAILFHGNGENIRSTYSLQKWLKAHGIESIAFDYRGYGYSTGWPSDRGLKEDVRTVLKHYGELLKGRDTEVILFGSSIGTGLAAYASQFLEGEILVLLAPYTSLVDLVREFRFLKPLSSFVWYDFDIPELLKEGSSSCVVIAHGELDTIIGIQHGRSVAAEAKRLGRAEFIEDSEAGHNDLLGRVRSELLDRIFQCLNRERS